MKTLIFTSIILLIAISSYSQTKSGSENTERSVSKKPTPSVFNSIINGGEPEVSAERDAMSVKAQPAPEPDSLQSSLVADKAKEVISEDIKEVIIIRAEKAEEVK